MNVSAITLLVLQRSAQARPTMNIELTPEMFAWLIGAFGVVFTALFLYNSRQLTRLEKERWSADETPSWNSDEYRRYISFSAAQTVLIAVGVGYLGIFTLIIGLQGTTFAMEALQTLRDSRMAFSAVAPFAVLAVFAVLVQLVCSLTLSWCVKHPEEFSADQTLFTYIWRRIWDPVEQLR